jgi:glycosyltransferase involved in cell wall biosynthesis
MKAESLPLVSIVTPVYNEKQFLPECIESVLAQSYSNWEYIIVDNCSTDGSAEIARKYAEKDARIRVYENPTFLRALPNHNSALGRISPQSKYCKIVFADDWIFPECLERMVALAEAHPSIGIVGGYVLQGEKVICAGLPYKTSLVRGQEICRAHLLNNLHVFGSANAVLFRADLVRNKKPFFNEANIHGDTEVCFSLLKSSDFGFVHQILTFTRVRLESLTMVSLDLQTWLAGTLQILIAHGQEYLSTDELDGLLRTHLSRYYKFIGKSLLLGQLKTVRFHRKKLTDAGMGFSWIRVLTGVFSTLFSLIMTPKTVADKLLSDDKRSKSTIPWERGVRNPVTGTLQGRV